MPRIPQGTAVKGSQQWLRKLVNEKLDLLSFIIRIQIYLTSDEEIHWDSPIVRVAGIKK
ncbi:MAG: hypothetical protein JRI42_05350 [Deltaproteobacteria bacterium]|nr:hypothetical protein [Deltaproteobacteria bacterium]